MTTYIVVEKDNHGTKDFLNATNDIERLIKQLLILQNNIEVYMIDENDILENFLDYMERKEKAIWNT